MMRSLVLLLGLAGSMVLLPACSDSKSNAAKSAAAPAVPVTVAVAEQADVPVQLRAIGTARAFASVSVKSLVDGQLAKVRFREGDEVRKGDLIFTIDPRSFQAALEQAQAGQARDEASLANAVADMKRTDELANTKAVSATVVDQNRAKVAALKATVAADKAAVDTAKVQLEYCSIRSPIDGRVGVLAVDQGNIVKNNETVLTIINQLKPIYVEFYLPEHTLHDVREAATKGKLAVEATLPRHEDTRVTGSLDLINNQVDTATGAILLRAVFPNADEVLWPGQFVNVALTLRVEKDKVVVPADAIQLSQQGSFVFVVKPDMTVEMRPVTTGQRTGDQIVVETGLQAQEKIVTSGQLRLVTGARIEIKGAENPSGKKS